MISAIVLAGGKSERMGRPKALLRYRGATFLEHILAAIEGSSIQHTVVVVGRHRQEIAEAMPAMPFVYNPDYEQGMSTSIQAGIRALEAETSAAVLFLVDHPLIDALTIDLLAAPLRPGQIVVPVHANRRGHPIVLSREVFEEILQLPPTSGANLVVRKDPSRVIEVPVSNPGVLRDIDTEEQYRELLINETGY